MLTFEKMKSYFVLLTLTMLLTFAKISEAVESLGVKGQLYCGRLPSIGTKVRLWDRSEGNVMLDETDTLIGGYFSLYGEKIKIRNPVLNIYHECNGLQVPSDF